MVLTVIASHANHDGSDAFPSVSRIAAMSGLTRKAVQLCLRELEAGGELVTEPMAGPRGANRYTVVVGHNDYAGSEDITPAQEVRPAYPTTPPPAYPTTPEPSIEPSLIVLGDIPTLTHEVLSVGNTEGGTGGTEAQKVKAPAGKAKSRPKGVNLAPLFDAFKKAGLPEPKILSSDQRYAGELITAYEPAAVVQCWKDIGALGTPSDFASTYMQRRRSFRALVTDNVVATWLAWVAAGRPPITRSANSGRVTTSQRPEDKRALASLSRPEDRVALASFGRSSQSADVDSNNALARVSR